MNRFRLAPLALALALSACGTTTTSTTSSTSAANQPVFVASSENKATTQLLNVAVNLDASNPFLTDYDTPYGVPAFDKIKPEHYVPAFEAGIKQQNDQIAAIIANPAKPTFANTIEAYEYSGSVLKRTVNVFFNLRGSNSDDKLREISSKVVPMLSAHEDNTFLNDAFFQRVKTVYNNKASFNLSIEQTRLLDSLYTRFTRGGANLSEADKNKLRELNQQLSKLSLQFGDNVLQETKGFEYYVSNKADLSGLSDSVIAAAANRAKAKGKEGQYLFIASRPSVTPVLSFADNRQLREAVFKGYTMRGDNNNEFDNKKIIAQMSKLRAQRAKLMGYETHAHYVLEERTAKTPQAVYELLEKIWPTALEKAKAEVKDIQAFADKDGANFKVEAWDYLYYAEKIRKARYDINEEEIKPYFGLDATIDGVFYTANRLFGLTAKEVNNIPKYHPEVRTFEIYDKDGALLGIFYGDYYVRDGKRGGAWMNSFQKQSDMNGDSRIPIIVNVLNYPRPTGDAPVLLTYDQASTLFHEFGHALHGLLSKGHYESQTGTATPRDFVEFPSQVLENWMAEPEVLANFAKHYETGEVIPQALVDKIRAASKFNQGFATVEYMAATYLDLDWHSVSDTQLREAGEFERQSMQKIGLIDEIVPRYRSTYFQHIFAGGYSAGYYSYIWSDVFGADGYQAFRENGIFDAETAQAFRDNVLSRGGTDDVIKLYRQFRGRDAEIEPLLRSRGLIE